MYVDDYVGLMSVTKFTFFKQVLIHYKSCFAVRSETAAFPQFRHASSPIWNARCLSSQITKLQLITLIGRYAVRGLLLKTHSDLLWSVTAGQASVSLLYTPGQTLGSYNFTIYNEVREYSISQMLLPPWLIDPTTWQLPGPPSASCRFCFWSSRLVWHRFRVSFRVSIGFYQCSWLRLLLT